MDALQLLKEQHDKVDAAFERYDDLPPSDEDGRIELARGIIADLSRHAAIEEVAFYPAVKDAMPDAADEIDHDLQEHQEAKELLDRLEGVEPGSGTYDETMQELIAAVRHHVEEEENDLFPRIRQAMTADHLAQLGDVLEQLTDVVPTRPHPHEPSTPPANTVTGPVAGMLDRLRDEIRERTSDSKV